MGCTSSSLSLPLLLALLFLRTSADSSFLSLPLFFQIEDLPYNVRVYRDNLYADDVFDRRVGKESKAAVHNKWGVSTETGGIVVVRPDGYVGAVVPLNEDGFEAINAYFAGFLSGSATTKKASL